ncbi:hypothetical protein DCAR_0208704 [Daucus carota subsp. sativus]|uniref:U-box domain-containing protein n=1 Tax=Daucus carota subsp. sativus TaxID=79200 RepID=A0A166ER63_DAUCS|nr:PREDICTED: U-box domain-containing protein 25 [Daucus carota subsp. sativus]WOG89466.1 hypothetical protein DCAR_0208704 [Daucus carota subsp. sativus]
MKTHNHHHHHPPKLKTPFFSCAFFRHCTQTVLSPTATSATTLPPPSAAPPPPPPPESSESSSSSSATSQSFTQWKFPLPLPTTPTRPDPVPRPKNPVPLPPPITATELQELFHVAELQLSTGSDSDRVNALHMLERSLVPNPHSVCENALCPTAVMEQVVSSLKEKQVAKTVTKVLLALCLAEGNRHVAVEAGAVGRVVEALPDLEGAAAERSLAALELLCTVEEGAAGVRAHALAVPMLVEAMGKITARGREYAIGVLAVIYGGNSDDELAVAPPEEVARAVVLALQGDCTARGKKKGAQLLKILQENGRLDLSDEEGNEE